MNNLEEVDPGDEARTYRAEVATRPRLPVVLAGPFMNLVIAFVLLFVAHRRLRHRQPDAVDGARGRRRAPPRPTAGLQPGDRVVSLDGEPIGDVRAVRHGRAGQRRQAGRPRSSIATASRSTLTADHRVGARRRHRRHARAARSPATSRSRSAISPWPTTRPSPPPSPPLADGRRRRAVRCATATSSTPESTPRSPRRSALPADGGRGFIGVSSLSDTVRQGPIEAVGERRSASSATWSTTSLGGIGRFFSPSGLEPATPTSCLDAAAAAIGHRRPRRQVRRRASTSSRSRPARRCRPSAACPAPPTRTGCCRSSAWSASAARPAQPGIDFVILLLAMVNIFLGLINLIPLLPFDGGHVAIATYEAIREPHRRPSATGPTSPSCMPVAYAVVAVLRGRRADARSTSTSVRPDRQPVRRRRELSAPPDPPADGRRPGPQRCRRRRRRADLGAVDDHHQDGRRRGHARSRSTPWPAPGATSCAAPATRSRRPRAWPQIVPRSPVPIIADIHHQYRRALAALEAGVHGLRLNPGNIRRPEHIKAVAARGQDRGRPDPHRRQRRLARPRALREVRRPVTPEAMVESAQRELAYFDEVGFDDVKISVKASNVPLMIEAYRLLADDRRLPAAPRRHRGRPAAGRAGQGHRRASPRCWPRASATPSATRSPPTRSRRRGPGASCSRRSGLRERKGLDLIACPSCGRAEVDVIEVAERGPGRARRT